MVLSEKCKVCGAELQYRREGSAQGLYCTKCDWSVVTTYIPPIDLDETIYRIIIRDTDCQNSAQIRAVSEAASVNFLDAKKILKEESPMIMQGNARTVAVARKKLSEAGLKVKIEPEFIY